MEEGSREGTGRQLRDEGCAQIPTAPLTRGGGLWGAGEPTEGERTWVMPCMGGVNIRHRRDGPTILQQRDF